MGVGEEGRNLSRKERRNQGTNISSRKGPGFPIPKTHRTLGTSPM